MFPSVKENSIGNYIPNELNQKLIMNHLAHENYYEICNDRKT